MLLLMVTNSLISIPLTSTRDAGSRVAIITGTSEGSGSIGASGLGMTVVRAQFTLVDLDTGAFLAVA